MVIISYLAVGGIILVSLLISLAITYFYVKILFLISDFYSLLRYIRMHIAIISKIIK